MKTSIISCAALALGLAGLFALSAQAQSPTGRPLLRPRPAAQASPGFKTAPTAQRPPAASGSLAPKLPDLIINAQSVTGAATLQGIKYRVPVTIKVRNQGSAKSAAFTVGVRFAQPAGAANPSLNQYTGTAPFLKADGSTMVMQELNPGQEIMLVGFVYLPDTFVGKTMRLRGKADIGGSPEHAKPWGSVKELSENNNWSAEMTVAVP